MNIQDIDKVQDYSIEVPSQISMKISSLAFSRFFLNIISLNF